MPIRMGMLVTYYPGKVIRKLYVKDTHLWEYKMCTHGVWRRKRDLNAYLIMIFAVREFL
jgi:hypothetical protein